jgi:hypothetical protein
MGVLAMNDSEYWFPVRPARDGWGWGLPTAWQGWLVLALWFSAVIAATVLLAPFGLAALLAGVAVLSSVLFGVMM